MTPPEQFATQEGRRDRAIALAALAVGHPPAAGECPPAAELAALLEDRLDVAGREGLFAHLAACPGCYEQWLTLAAVAGEEGGRRVIPGPWGRGWRPGVVFYWISGMTLALAASLALFLLPMVRTATVAELVTAAYQRPAWQRPPGGGEIRQLLPLPWEGGPAGYGFAPDSSPSSAAQAFGNGMVVGRELLGRETKLTGANPPVATKLAQRPLGGRWEASAAAPYYWLGRWLILLQYACLVTDFPEAGPFWQEQGKTLARLQSDLAARPAEEAATAVAGLQRLASGLAELGTHPGDRRALRRVNREIAALARELAPTGPPR